MSSAIFDTMSVEIIAKGVTHKYDLRSSGSTLQFPGFLVVYEDAKDNEKNNGNNNGSNDVLLPSDLKDGQLLQLVRLIPEQHFTQPPPRYSEATLVQTLEEYRNRSTFNLCTDFIDHSGTRLC